MVLTCFMGLLLSQPMSFDDALALTEQTPALMSQVEAIQRQAQLAGQVPWVVANPAFFVQPGVRHTGSGSTAPEFYVGLSQEVSLAGAGTSRASSARAEVEASRLALRLSRRRLRLDVAQRWLSLWVAQALLESAYQESRLANEWLSKVERGSGIGELTRVDVAVARAWCAEAALAALSFEGETFRLGVSLNQLLALSRLTPARAASELPAVVASSVPTLTADVSTAPSVQLARAEADVHRARTDELVAQRGTSLQVGAMGWREGGGDVAAVATFQLTLPLFERAQRERSAQVAAHARAEGLVEGVRADELAQRVDAHHELEHTREVLTVVERQLLPATREAAVGTERRFDAGEATAQELVLARRSLVAAQGRFVAARAEAVLAWFRWGELSNVKESP